MSELKFRAWSLGNKMKGIEPHYIEDFAIDAFYGTPKDIFDGNRSEDGIECIEQYTGLKDKNGKEIYEGDILRWEYRFMDGRKSTNTMIVRWNQSECCFEIHFIKGNFGDSMLDDDSCDEYEVIGNIHENPELFGGEE